MHDTPTAPKALAPHELRTVAMPDLRTPDQRHADDMAALTARIDLLEAAIVRQADVLQVLMLRLDDRT
jgi:hypothetical protein